MALLTWKEEYTVNHQEIDNQHKKLVEIINQLHTAMSNGKTRDELSKIFRSLLSYTRIHFSYEEKYLESINYENLLEHRKEHIKLEEQVKDYYSQYESGRIAITIKLMNFLRSWLIDHILTKDKKYIQ